MVESLRARLLVWHSAIVTAVVAIFGGTVCYLVWRAGLADVDAALAARAQTIADALRPAGRGTFDFTLAPADSAGGTVYHILWARDGTPIDWSEEAEAVPRPLVPGTRMRDGQRELIIQSPAGATILVGRSLEDLRRELWSLLALLLAVEHEGNEGEGK